LRRRSDQRPEGRSADNLTIRSESGQKEDLRVNQKAHLKVNPQVDRTVEQKIEGEKKKRKMNLHVEDNPGNRSEGRTNCRIKITVHVGQTWTDYYKKTRNHVFA